MVITVLMINHASITLKNDKTDLIKNLWLQYLAVVDHTEVDRSLAVVVFIVALEDSCPCAICAGNICPRNICPVLTQL